MKTSTAKSFPVDISSLNQIKNPLAIAVWVCVMGELAELSKDNRSREDLRIRLGSEKGDFNRAMAELKELNLVRVYHTHDDDGNYCTSTLAVETEIKKAV